MHTAALLTAALYWGTWQQTAEAGFLSIQQGNQQGTWSSGLWTGTSCVVRSLETADMQPGAPLASQV